MAFFKKLFEKKECDFCGGEIGLLGNRKLEDGNMCKECAKKLSPWFDERRHSTVEQINRQLAAREENRKKLQTWNHSMVFGEYQKIYINFLGRIPDSFVISSVSDYKEANADIIPFCLVNSCDLDIRESHRELKQKNAQGEQVSYNPPRYEYSYEFYIKMTIMGIEYIDDMSLRLNRNTLKLESIQRAAGRGLLFSQAFDPMHYPEYREYKSIADTVKQVIACGRQGLAYQLQASGCAAGNVGDPFPAIIDQIRNAPTVAAAFSTFTALSQQLVNHPNKDAITSQATEALNTVKMREFRQAAAAAPMASATAASAAWTCPSCGASNTGKFCSGCGSPKPVSSANDSWTCFCGTKNTTKFCMECGTTRFAPSQIWCSECSWTMEPGDTVIPQFCPNCGKKFNNDDIR